MGSAADSAVFALWRLSALLRHPRLHWKYVRRMKRIPDVAVPRLYSERMLWRKLFDRNPDFVTFSDKLACKRWIAERLPDLPIPRVLWQGERPEDIPPHLIRPGVAIKANHGSTFNLLIRDAPPPRERVVETARRWLATDWGRRRGEWCYAPVPRRLFVEELIAPTADDPPRRAAARHQGACRRRAGQPCGGAGR
ncbi:MAG: ATP-grasp fold amidoligase family protein [Acetobacteraceae bacterium]|nr:ATP-grasp fold amidoligase family protein [Acetobacteraceae bacterium]